MGEALLLERGRRETKVEVDMLAADDGLSGVFTVVDSLEREAYGERGNNVILIVG
jgi:hypothetical protein